MIYSASQAAKAVGKSTATITRAIYKGRLSAVKDESGAWLIDASELHRVFALASPENPSMKHDEKGHENHGMGAEVGVLSERLRSAEQRAAVAEALAEERARHLDDLQRRLDAEAEERRRLVAVLTAPPAAPVPPSLPEPAPLPRPRRWWPWAGR